VLITTARYYTPYPAPMGRASFKSFT